MLCSSWYGVKHNEPNASVKRHTHAHTWADTLYAPLDSIRSVSRSSTMLLALLVKSSRNKFSIGWYTYRTESVSMNVCCLLPGRGRRIKFGQMGSTPGRHAHKHNGQSMQGKTKQKGCRRERGCSAAAKASPLRPIGGNNGASLSPNSTCHTVITQHSGGKTQKRPVCAACLTWWLASTAAISSPITCGSTKDPVQYQAW